MARTTAQREASRMRKQRQRDRQRERDRMAAEAEAARQEAIAEHLAPAVRRLPIVTPDGRMLVGARVRIVGGRPSLADPIANLARNSPLFTDGHKRAARQLQQDWHDVGTGCGVGAVDYLRSGGAGDGQGGHEAMLAQITTRARLDGAMAYLGAFAPGISRVVLDCVPVEVWSQEVDKPHGEALAWIAAGLLRLVGFYWPPSRGCAEVRTIGPRREAYMVEAVG